MDTYFKELDPICKTRLLTAPYTYRDKRIYLKHDYKINSEWLRLNLSEECQRDICVSYFPLLPLLNEQVPLEEADYIIYGHFYARFHNFQEVVKEQIEELIERRKTGAKIIIVGKACNIKPYLDPNIPDIIYYESRYASKLGEFFNVPIKDEYFVYDKVNNQLSMWPVDGCLNKCKFCRRSYMHIPFESLSLDYIKENLDWYKENCPEKMKEVLIRAENLTQYGLDIYGYQALPQLLELIYSYPEIETIYFPIGLNIGEMNDEIINTICNSPKKLKIAMNIETASNRLLNLIGKPHTKEQIINVFSRIKKAQPDCMFFTNVMLGLPTEEIVDIFELAELIDMIEIDDIYILRYVMDEKQSLTIYPKMPINIYEYHLQLLISLLRKNRRRDLQVTCENVWGKKRRSYIRKEMRLDQKQRYYYEQLYHKKDFMISPNKTLVRKK